MKYLKELLEAASPGKVSARDISAYYRQVKISLKGNPAFKAGKVSKSAISSAVREIADNDPDSTINCNAVASGIWARYVADYKTAKPVSEDMQDPRFDNARASGTSTRDEMELSSDDRSFSPGAGGMGEGDDVAKLKALRCKDIGEELTDEQQDELRSLEAGGDECDDECGGCPGCNDPECPDCCGDDESGEEIGGHGGAPNPFRKLGESWDKEEEEEGAAGAEVATAKLSPKAQAILDKRLKAQNAASKLAKSTKLASRKLGEARKQAAADKIVNEATFDTLRTSLLATLETKPGSFLK